MPPESLSYLAYSDHRKGSKDLCKTGWSSELESLPYALVCKLSESEYLCLVSEWHCESDLYHVDSRALCAPIHSQQASISRLDRYCLALSSGRESCA